MTADQTQAFNCPIPCDDGMQFHLSLYTRDDSYPWIDRFHAIDQLCFFQLRDNPRRAWARFYVDTRTCRQKILWYAFDISSDIWRCCYGWIRYDLYCRTNINSVFVVAYHDNRSS